MYHDENLLNLLREYFSFDFSVLIAQNISDAIQLIQDNEIIIIVVDLHLGLNDGFELLKFTKNKFPEINRVLMTGDSRLFVAQKAINEARVVKYYNKPFSFEEMRSDFKTIMDAFNKESQSMFKYSGNGDRTKIIEAFFDSNNSTKVCILRFSVHRT